MIRISLRPSFLNHCLIEIKENDGIFRLVFIKNSDDRPNEKGYIWTAKTTDKSRIELLEKRLIDITENPTNYGRRIILDGVWIEFTLVKDGREYKRSFGSPEPSRELDMLREVLDFTNDLLGRQAGFERYFELLEGWFFDVFPVKEYDEVPYRVKIFDRLSINEKEDFCQKIKEIAQKDPLLIDMSNFFSMGTALYPCFKPLFEVKDLRFIATKYACKQLLEIGFDAAIIEVME